jgi:hypothetical protein
MCLSPGKLGCCSVSRPVQGVVDVIRLIGGAAPATVGPVGLQPVQVVVLVILEQWFVAGRVLGGVAVRPRAGGIGHALLAAQAVVPVEEGRAACGRRLLELVEVVGVVGVADRGGPAHVDCGLRLDVARPVQRVAGLVAVAVVVLDQAVARVIAVGGLACAREAGRAARAARPQAVLVLGPVAIHVDAEGVPRNWGWYPGKLTVCDSMVCVVVQGVGQGDWLGTLVVRVLSLPLGK